MTLRFHILSMFAIASTAFLTSCSWRVGPNYSYLNPTVSISPQISSISINGSQAFTAAVMNTESKVVWSVQSSEVPAVSVGNFSPTTTYAPTGTYTAPPTPPIYSATQIASGAVQGSVVLSATVADSPASGLFTKTSLAFVIVGPVSVGLSPATAALNVGGTQQFTGYAVGSTNNTLTWQVNGVTGGGTAMGTITTAGLYTAPMSIPMTGNTITITAVSQADKTRAASAVVTLAFP
jgi:hypothetical protein